jgi:hypothetical protein
VVTQLQHACGEKFSSSKGANYSGWTQLAINPHITHWRVLSTNAWFRQLRIPKHFNRLG